MPIAALSEAASRAITSTLVLNDAISVIKELIDNSLDSHATNITIEISANTVNVIQVKDNGSGIGVEDRQLLCKRGYTSKIRNLEDLEQLGGTFLGFRGEALASIAELCESIGVITRVEGEPVATQLKFSSEGKLTSASSASHGTGTTVRLTNFLEGIPVRKQIVLKNSSKTLINIKRLLFDYAFARPTVRFQFKVLKSKNDFKENWLFPPCRDAENLTLLASKIVGKEIVGQCRQESVATQDGKYLINALLLSPDADVLKSILSSDQYASIDGRPLASERGFMRDLTKIYRRCLRKKAPEGAFIPKKVFLLLHLQCPKGAYDVNVEPAKNEVIFEDVQQVSDLFEELCKQMYGEEMCSPPTNGKHPAKPSAMNDNGFNVLLANHNPLSVPAMDNPLTTHAVGNAEPNLDLIRTDQIQGVSGPKTHKNMYEMDSDDEHPPPSELEDLEEQILEETDIMSPHVTNPFTLAKVNTLVRTRQIDRGLVEEIQGRNLFQSAPLQRTQSANNGATSVLPPSPSTSPARNQPFQNPGPPNRPWKRKASGTDEQASDTSPIRVTPSSSSRTRPTLLDAWAQNMKTPPTNVPVQPEGMPLDSLAIQRQHGLSTKRKPSPIEVASQQQPFRTPLKKTSEFQAIPETNLPSSNPCLAPGPSLTPNISPSMMRNAVHGPRSPDSHRITHASPSELDDIMDFEYRKRATVLQHRNRYAKHGPRGSDLSVNDRHVAVSQFPPSVRSPSPALVDEPADYGSRFTDDTSVDDSHIILSWPGSASRIQSPHLNRYKKTVRTLEQSSVGDVADGHDHTGESAVVRGSDFHVISSGTKLLPKDPRAYLLRLKARNDDRSGNADRKKIQVAKLPFETIPTENMLFDRQAVITSEAHITARVLTAVSSQLKAIDIYAVAGTIEAAWKDVPLRGDDDVVSYAVIIEQLMLQKGMIQPKDGTEELFYSNK